MKNLLNSVKIPTVKKSFFDMSYEHKTTFDMFDLIPVGVTPVVPSDRVTIGVDSLLKMQPMLAPLMHLVNVTTHTFFVPYRILWKGTGQNNRWNDFIANIKTLGVLPVAPYLDVSTDDSNQPGGLANYLGLPKDMQATNGVSAFNFAAYQCIYNEYYRDQNLVPEVPYLLTDAENDATELVKLRRRAWEKDYFTAALPFAQKGDAVTLPIGNVEDVNVFHNGVNTALDGTPADINVGGVASDNPDIPAGALYADTSSMDIGSTTINDLRVAYTLQRWYEQLARGGTRPNEFLKVMFNINSRDARLQRPEYICGSVSPFAISEVLNTTGSFAAGDPQEPTSNVQGSMSGHGVGVTKGKQGTFFVEEYGVIMTIMSVVPKSLYYQGTPREYRKTEPTQYFMPTFDHLGEQEIKNEEIYAGRVNYLDDFGYIPRYAEYKVPVNRVSGQFQTTLDFWHLGRKFDVGDEPDLNEQFITGQPDFRIFAVEQEDHQSILASVWNDLKMVRPMSKYSTPTF